MSVSQRTASSGLWFAHAWLPSGIAQNVRVTIDGERIREITTNCAPEPEDVTYPGLMIPGAANAHSHAFHRVLRGAGAAGRDFWQWRNAMYRAATRLTPELYEVLATALFREMLSAGYTSVAEFHYLHHRESGERYGDPNAMGHALARAAQAAGIRLTLLDACYLTSGFGEGPDETQRRFSDGSAAAWAERVDELTTSPLVRIGAAIHSVRAVPENEMAVVSAWAERNDAVLHVHFSEQPRENQQTYERTGLTPTALLDRAGVWGPRTVGVHGVHTTDDDIAILAARGAGVCICPSTEADLADGIAPAKRLAEAGVRLSIGSDQNVQIDPFFEARSLELHERLSTGEREQLSPVVLLRSLTEYGQQMAGWSDSGRIEVGMLADLIVLDMDSDNTIGVRLDRAALHARPSDVRAVYVGGRLIPEHQPDPQLRTLIRSLRSEQ